MDKSDVFYSDLPIDTVRLLSLIGPFLTLETFYTQIIGNLQYNATEKQDFSKRSKLGIFGKTDRFLQKSWLCSKPLKVARLL